MTCRRKTKTTRELLTDINKAFTIFCKSNCCQKCKYKSSSDCRLDWVIELLEKDNKEV